MLFELIPTLLTSGGKSVVFTFDGSIAPNSGLNSLIFTVNPEDYSRVVDVIITPVGGSKADTESTSIFSMFFIWGKAENSFSWYLKLPEESSDMRICDISQKSLYNRESYFE